MELTKSDFENLSRFVYKTCGIVIKDEKTYLIQQRLEPIAKSIGCKNFAELCFKLSANCSSSLHDQIIAAITTNETSFFRDTHPFDTFKNTILPKLGNLVEERKNRKPVRKGAKIRIWCAASSTGQEPYCLAMIIYEYTQGVKYRGITENDFEIMATDISSKVLAKAIAGEYSDFEITRGLQPSHKNKFFIKENGLWLIDNRIKDMVEFKRLNLMKPFTMLGGFDVIFCRNVLIYFDDPAKRSIFDQ
ncbi:MAG: CheR family methyltransferase, partial [Candidatus Anammoxibacter sp.]